MATVVQKETIDGVRKLPVASESAQTPEALFEKILAERRELSSLPHTLAEVIRASRDENSSAESIADIILKDTGLCARILRAANSPLYGQSREVKGVRQAVQVIGVRAIVTFALSSSVYSLSSQLPGSLDRMRFWRHALETAAASRLIARINQTADPEMAFICGLLHDIGKLILDATFTNQYKRIICEVEAGASFCDLETAEWGVTHATVGRFLLDQWNLPSEIVDAVGAHHWSPSATDASALSDLGACVALANAISPHRLTLRSGDAAERFARKAALMDKLALDDYAMLRMQDNLSEEFIRLASYLEIDIGDPLELLRDANAAMYGQYQLLESLLRDNQRMSEQLSREQLQRELLRSVHAIAGTYNHYLNNATAAIQGQAQLLQIRAQKVDSSEVILGESISTIGRSVEMISAVLEAMNNLSTFATSCYHDDIEIFDIESELKIRKQELERLKEKYS